MANQYDVIVVGAGNGGLIAACTAAGMHLRTLLLEKHNLPGGCATSFVRGRFEFEASLHNLPFMGQGEARGETGQLFDRLGVDVPCYPIRESLHFILTGNNGFEFSAGTGRDSFAAEAERYVPGCTQSLDRFYALCDDLNRGLAYISVQKGPPDFGQLIRMHPNYIRLASSTVQEMYDAIELPEKLQQIISIFALYQCCNVRDLDAARFMLMVDSFIKYGAYQPRRRSHGISSAIADSARNAGCDIWYNAEVRQILTANGRVCGVRLTDGSEVMSDNIICNVIPHAAYGKLINPAAVPVPEMKKANARTFGGRGFCFFLGLNKAYGELGISHYSVFIIHDLNNAAIIRQGATRESNPCLSANCLNLVVPDCSPPGTCMLCLTTVFSEDTWQDVTPENYTRIKREFADRLIACYESATGVRLRDSIEEVVISTPVTYARYLGTPQGTIFGYYPQDWDGMMSRTMGEYFEQTIPGLSFVGGHGTRMSGYVPSYMSGYLAALKLAEQMKGGHMA
jgi:phytoene dehydrogenase-like protein